MHIQRLILSAIACCFIAACGENTPPGNPGVQPSDGTNTGNGGVPPGPNRASDTIAPEATETAEELAARFPILRDPEFCEAPQPTDTAAETTATCRPADGIICEVRVNSAAGTQHQDCGAAGSYDCGAEGDEDERTVTCEVRDANGSAVCVDIYRGIGVELAESTCGRDTDPELTDAPVETPTDAPETAEDDRRPEDVFPAIPDPSNCTSPSPNASFSGTTVTCDFDGFSCEITVSFTDQSVLQDCGDLGQYACTPTTADGATQPTGAQCTVRDSDGNDRCEDTFEGETLTESTCDRDA